MNIDLIPTLVDQYRETFEGEVAKGMCWITSGTPDSALLGTLDAVTAQQAFAAPIPGGRSIAAHAEHLRFTLALTLRRLHGENPTVDWSRSFDLREQTPESWTKLKRDLRQSYQAVLDFLQERRLAPVEDWQPIHVAGLCAMTAHNAYHLGAIRQIAKVVQK
jgi:hypothetical protein